ncbi:ERF superfamily protein [Phaeobacter inhibens]|uniref:ERF family protein n=1 Tax=Phaeobacter inhibens TaxID=221822 RepID=UPI000C9CD06F|nr:ERF family protein [Phaeobacter inhibens]AUR11183.1 ERF superfamily protein [Phaeobacter inhibens]
MKQIANISQEDQALPVDPMVSMIERVAMDPNSDLAKLERMLELKERHDAQNAKAAYASAFAQASAEFPTIPLNGKGHNGKPYATLEDITKLTRPVLSQYGLALTFAVDVGEQVVVTAKLMHKAGHSESTSMALPRDTSGSKNAVQAVGSTQKYGQRYTAQAILGLSLGMDDEDDGRAAAGRGEPISVRQYDELRQLIDQAGITEEIVCTAEKLGALHDLPARHFERVSGRLQQTVKNRGAQQ